MSRTIEQKVVEMQFDNSNFEKNVSTSMNTLNKLQDTITKTTSGNSFADLGKSINGLSFSGLTASIQTVSEKFSALEQLAIGALRNIGANIEQHLVNALNKVTVAQVAEGFDKYGIMNEATQTILSAISGDERYDEIDNKLEYVEELLEKLAWFSDETSYGLTDMTDNIAKFTAAGIDLEDSADAMIGISNWAALSGQNARVAARAYYQLSQAMGMGSIQLVDWKSIEVANMATKEVKELLLEYGVLNGELQKVGEGKYLQAGIDASKMTAEEMEKFVITYNNFRQHLTEERWLTSEVFTDAMGEYAAYSNALYKILQNEENSINTASELMGYIDRAMEKSEETGKSIEDIMMEDYKINIMVEDENGSLQSALAGVTELGIKAMKMSQQARTWRQVVDSITDAASTQWMYIFQQIFGNVEEATELFTDLANYFYKVFVDPLWDIKDLLKEWKDLGGRSLLFEGDQSALANLKTAFSGLIDSINAGIEKVFPPKTAEDLMNLTKRFVNFTSTLVLTEAQSNKITNAVSKVLGVLKTFGSIVSSTFKTVSRVFTQVKDTFTSVFTPNWLLPARTGFSDFFKSFAHALNRILSGIKLSDGAIEKLKDVFGGVRSIINALGEAFAWLSEKIKSIGDNRLDKIIGRFIGGDFLEFLLFIPSKIGKAVTSIIEFIKTSEGFHKFIDVIATAVRQTKEFFKGFFDAMFPEGIVKVISNLKDKISSLFETMKGSEKFQKAKERVKDFFSEVKSFFENNVTYEKGVELFNNLKTSISNFGESVGSAFEKAKNAIKEFIKNSKILSTIGNWIDGIFNPVDTETGLKKAKKTFGQIVSDIFGGIWDAIKWVANGIKFLWNGLKSLWENLDLGDWIKTSFKGIGDFFRRIIEDLDASTEGMTTAQFIAAKVKAVFKALGTVIGHIFGFISDVLPGVSMGAGGLAIGKGLIMLSKFFAQPFQKLFGGLKEFIGGMSESIGIFVESLKLEQLGEMLSKTIKSLAIFLLALAAAVYIMASVKNPEQLPLLLGAIATFIAELFGAMALLINQMTSTDVVNAFSKSSTMKGISKLILAMGISLLLVAVALSEVIKAVDGKSLDTLIIAALSIMGLLAEIAGITTLLMEKNQASSGSGKAFNGLALTLVAMALAVKILASVIKTLGELDIPTLIKGTVAVGVLVLLVSLFTYVADGADGVLGAGIGLIAMAAAIKIMAGIVKDLGEVDTNSLIKGLVAVGVLTIFAGLLAAVCGDQEGLLAAGIALVLMSAAISIMASVATKLGAIDSKNMWQGILGVAAIVGILAIFAVIAGHTNSIVKAGIGLVAMAAAVAIIGGILLAIAAFSKTEGGNDALWGAILKVGVALLTLVAIGYLCGPVTVPLIAFAAAVALVGVGLLAFATAASVFVATLILVTSTTALTATAIGAALTAIFNGIVEAGPALVEALGTIINSLLSALLNSKALIIETVLEFITGLLETLAEYLPRILDALGVILDSIWEFLTERFITFIESLHDVWLVLHDNLKEDLDILADDIHEGIQKVISYIDEDLNSIADNIYDFTMKIADQIFGGGEYEGLIPRILRGLEESAVNFWTSAKNIISAFGEGIDECAIIAISAFGTLITDVIDSIADFNEDLLQAVEDFIFSLADSIKNHGTNIVIGITRIITNLMDIMFMVLGGDETQEGSLAYLAKYFWDGLWAALKARADAFGEKVKGLAKKVLPDPVCKVLGIQSPSKVAMEIGEYFMDGLAIGVENGEEEGVDAVTDAAGSIKSAMSKAMSTIDTLLSDDEYQPTITPVMDLSQIQNGMYTMGNLLNTYDNYTMQAAVAANYNPYTYQDGTIKVDTETQMADSIATLENKFDEMLYKLGKIRVVLDSGTLVGELVDPMDEALGRKAVYVGRGM